MCVMERDNRTRLVEATSTSDMCGVYTREWYDGPTENETGVPSLDVLDIVYNHIVPHLTPMKLDSGSNS